jgi:hypothetical protein
MTVTPSVYQALAVKHALKLYAKHKLIVNRAYTPTRMLDVATAITGQSFKRGQYEQAANAINTWLAINPELVASTIAP